MRSASSKLIKLLDADQFITADLYTITTVQNDVFRYTTYDFDLVIDNKLFSCSGPIISRDGISLSLGITVDKLSVTINCLNDQMWGDVNVVQAFHNGQMDGARLLLERVFIDANDLSGSNLSSLKLFEGRIIEPEIDRNTVEINVASDLDDLAIQMPRDLYQPSCSNSLFDTACGLLRQNFMVESVINANSSTSRILCDLNNPQGWFTQGVIEFLDGGNSKLKRTIRLHESGTLHLSLPLLEEPREGQRIIVYPGCDKRLETCKNRFANFEKFRGTPFIPVPETAV